MHKTERRSQYAATLTTFHSSDGCLNRLLIAHARECEHLFSWIYLQNHIYCYSQSHLWVPVVGRIGATQSSAT